MATQLVQVSATGAVLAAGCRIKSAHLAAGSGAAATAILDDSTDGSGADLLKLAAVQGGGDHWVAGDKQGVLFTTAVYATLAGSGAILSVELEKF